MVVMRAALVLVSVLLCGACGNSAAVSPPEVQHARAPATASPPAATSPPAPKCESLEEKCVAFNTRLEIGPTGVWFLVPENFTYARQAGYPLAVSPDGSTVVAFAPASSTDETGPHDAVGLLLDRLEITNVHESDSSQTYGTPSGDISVSTRRNPHPQYRPQRNGRDGYLYMASATMNDQGVVGVAFMSSGAPDQLFDTATEALQSLYVPNPGRSRLP